LLIKKKKKHGCVRCEGEKSQVGPSRTEIRSFAGPSNYKDGVVFYGSHTSR
jgi:hypothetical protein